MCNEERKISFTGSLALFLNADILYVYTKIWPKVQGDGIDHLKIIEML